MISYRFRRRAFITALSGGVGLKILLRNLEGSAQGMRSPGRLLVTHWPLGIVPGASDALWRPLAGSVRGSPALQLFADLGLAPDMTVIRGLSTSSLSLSGGGAEEQGTVALVTGRAAAGTRNNCCEGDDAYAAPGGSIDQILLANAPALQRPGLGYANSIADNRTDFGEVSTRCLSYSTETQSVTRYASTGVGTEAKPLLPVLSPLQQYTNLFANFIPGTPGTGGAGGAPAPVADAVLKKLVGRRSVLDFAIEELNQVKRMAPSQARNKLSLHTEAVAQAESAIVNTIDSRYPNGGGSGGMSGNGDPTCGGTCMTKPAAPPPTMGMGDPDTGRGTGLSIDGTATQDDAPIHAQVGRAHLDVLKAAFICDLIRVGTYQWSPGTNHVGFALYPGTTQPYLHHPMSHRITTTNDVTSASTIAGLSAAARFLFNVQVWYFARVAENFASWKSAVDGCGNSLLDFTCIPFLTEVETAVHGRSNMAGMIIGGKQLGFVHDRYVTGNFSINRFWGTVGQAFGYTSIDPPFATPLPDLWTKPAGL